MKIRSPIARRKPRLEIIPLIDIMFFLLASFMMVSLQMQKVRTLAASLPTATLARSTAKPDIVNLNVDRLGQIALEHEVLAPAELLARLTNRLKANPNVPVYLSGDADAKHGDLVYWLDFVRRAGVARVAVAVQAETPHTTP